MAEETLRLEGQGLGKLGTAVCMSCLPNMYWIVVLAAQDHSLVVLIAQHRQIRAKVRLQAGLLNVKVPLRSN